MQFLKPELPPYARLGFADWKIYAGPFKDAPRFHTRNLCLQAETPSSDVIHRRLPIADFNIPEVRPAAFAVAWMLWQGLALQRHVYVGCMGGTGRTGMMLAILVRVVFNWDGADAISHVRKYYREYAVETYEQEDFVSDFPIRNLRRFYVACKLISKVT